MPTFSMRELAQELAYSAADLCSHALCVVIGAWILLTAAVLSLFQGNEND